MKELIARELREKGSSYLGGSKCVKVSWYLGQDCWRVSWKVAGMQCDDLYESRNVAIAAAIELYAGGK